MFENYGPNQKTITSQKTYTITIVSKNLVQICPLVTEIQDVGENVCLILYDINLCENKNNIKKSQKKFPFSILCLYTKFCPGKFLTE